MKQLITFLSTIFVSTYCFAGISDSGLSAGSTQLKALNSAWKTQLPNHLQQSKNDITMVYGGEDVSRRPTLDPRSTTA